MSFSAKSFKKIAEKSSLIEFNSIVCETNSYVKKIDDITEEYITAVTEVLEIIRYTNKPSVNKFSQKLLNFFEEVCDKNYVEKFDSKIELDENNLSPKTRALITMLYRNYLCQLKERELLDEILIRNNNNLKNDIEDDSLGEDEEVHDDRVVVCTVSDSEEYDEELEDDKQFNSYVNVKDLDLEKQIAYLNKLQRKLKK